DKAHHQRAGRRDHRREVPAADGLARLAGGEESPSELAAGKELLEEVNRRLSAEERELAEQRAHGRPWADLAAERGVSPDALRKQLTRALDRVRTELRLHGRES